jgi:hypothetical protein
VRQDAGKLDKVSMLRATGTAHAAVLDHLDRAARLQRDDQRVERMSRGLCSSCFYLQGWAGCASCTTRPCALCHKDQSYGSTATDVLCLSCACSNSLCKRCGGDIDLRILRRKWPDASESSSDAPSRD